MQEIVFSSELCVYSTNEFFLRVYEKGKIGRLNDLSKNEFFSFCMKIENRSKNDFICKNVYVVVDGGQPWGWADGVVSACSESRFHIFYCNMKSLSKGTHTAIWYADGKKIFSDAFTVTEDLNWAEITKLPTAGQIASYTNPKNLRSPYMALWMSIPWDARYREYMIDFKADHLPRGTYCALGNWCMDLSSLEKTYKKVKVKGIYAYAGFQDAGSAGKKAIMYVWDIYCTNSAGKESVIRAKIDYPKKPEIGKPFDNEYEGIQCINSFEWEAGHWYRMHLRLYDSPAGSTMMEMWAADLENGSYTLICRYDTLVSDFSIAGPMCIFLENFDESTAGEIRSLEICNAKYLDQKSKRWCEIHSGTFHINGSAFSLNYAGSYDYGAKNGHLWMMTTGVDHCGNTTKPDYIDWSK